MMALLSQRTIPAKQMLQCGGKSSALSRCTFIFLCFGLWISSCQAEYFSSIDSIQMLVVAEEDLIEWFQKFISAQAEDFAVYRNFIAKVKKEHALAEEDPESYLGNPLNAYKLIKRTVIDWKQLTDYVKHHPRLQALKTNLAELESDIKKPDSSELRGAAKGLGRLQTVYNLSSDDLAKGIINDIYYGSELSVRECFEIGANLFEAKEYPLSISWSKLVLKSLEKVSNKDNRGNKLAKEHEENGVPPKKHNETVTTEDTSGLLEIGSECTADDYCEVEDYEDEAEDGVEGEEDADADSDAEVDADGEEYGKHNEDEKDTNKEELLDDADEVRYEEKLKNFSPVVLYELDESRKSEQRKTHKRNSNGKVYLGRTASINRDKENDTTLKLSKGSLTNQKTSRRKFDDKQLARKMYIDTLEYLALAEYELGRRENATAYIDKIVQLDPEHALKDLEPFMNARTVPNRTYFDSFSELQKRQWYSNYSRLCQGRQVPQKDIQQLECKLDTLNHPLFQLAPLKKEVIHADPEVTVYYGMLSDIQIGGILHMVEGGMYRSQVGGANEGSVRDVRVSQQTWLPYDTPTLKYIYRTVSAVSGFDLSNAETMQVANYGVGGQYDPHWDYFAKEDPNAPWVGDRISTNLFYLSDVDQGGYTVFPILNIYSKPVKGSMVMWHNLHKSLDPDARTLHAGCPVIKGTKRISNVWIHSGYQEFRRPCDVARDNYKSAPWQLIDT